MPPESQPLISAGIKANVTVDVGTSVVFLAVGIMLGILAIVIFVKIYK